MKPAVLLALLVLSLWWLPSRADNAPVPLPVVREPPPLQPFVARYDAWHAGKPAGSASLQLLNGSAGQWRIDLGISGHRGFAGVLGLNLQQSTVFEEIDGQYRPLGQSTVRKGLLLGRKSSGVYDWAAHSARWSGDLKDKRKQPIALRDGDMSGLLINLAVIRDAQPGKRLHYRYVDGGRAREHVYQVAAETETVAVGELSYAALRVSRGAGGADETILWIASGVPTPVRILQRENGQDTIDLRLTAYQGSN